MQHTLSFYTDTFVLVEQWTTGSILGVLGAMFAACAVSSLFEWLSRFLYNWDRTPLQTSDDKRCRSLTRRSLRSGFHALSVTAGYLLMLLLMTYNLWVMISILIGSATGYFWLGPKVDQRSQSRRKNPVSKQNSRHEESTIALTNTENSTEIHAETEIPMEATTANMPLEAGNLNGENDAISSVHCDSLRGGKNNTGQGRDYRDDNVEETEDLLVKKDNNGVS